MARKKDYTCHCALRPLPHKVLLSEQDIHEEQLRLLERNTTQPVNHTNDEIEQLGSHLATLTIAHPSVSPLVQSPDHDQAEIQKLASYITALTITDDGPDLARQPSKLFVSRNDFQENHVHIPTLDAENVDMDAAFSGVTAFLTASPPAGFTWRDSKATNLVSAIEKHLRDAEAALTVPPEYNETDLASVVQMHQQLQTASDIFHKAKTALENIKRVSTAAADAALGDLHEKIKHFEGELKAVDARITSIGAILPPLVHDSSHIMDTPMQDMTVIAQLLILLGLICHVIIRVADKPCNFIIKLVTLIIKETMKLHSQQGPDESEQYDAKQKNVLEQLPSSLYVALQSFKIDAKTTMFAVCPSCHWTHKPLNPDSAFPEYPARCVNRVVEADGARICDEELLELRNGKLRPVRTFLFPSFHDHLAMVLSDPEIEKILDTACDDAFAARGEKPSSVTNIFQAEFMNEFEGPTPGKLFIDRRGRLRVPCSIHLDFFQPHGVGPRSNSDKLGCLSVAIVGLTELIRYKPEYIYTSLICGPGGPKGVEVNGYLNPIIDEAVVAWKRGIHISSTGGSPLSGRQTEFAFVISVNDLPAARQVSGMAGVTSECYCTVCNCRGLHTLYRTDFEHPDWRPRDVNELRKQAEAWRDADTLKERNLLFEKHGMRWSEFWRLPYWNPSRMLVIDAMHCILEGLVHYHCRHVLQIDAEVARSTEKPDLAFSFPWPEYEPLRVPLAAKLKEEDLKQIPAVQKKLESALDCEGGITTEHLKKNLTSRTVPIVAFLCWSLKVMPKEPGTGLNGKIIKADYVQSLITWRKLNPMKAPDNQYRRLNPTKTADHHRPKTIQLSDIQFIHKVIAEIDLPSWLDSVPKNFGEAAAGQVKANEWKNMGTIILPLALVLLWGEMTGPHADHFYRILVHTMALFQATMIVCRYSTDLESATDYRNLLKQWVDDLHSIHPHTKQQKKRNVHVAFHIYDFLRLFGPIVSWWCFPFERLIGILQKIKHNDHIGGEMEHTMLRSFMRGASIRRWLARKDCPPVIREVKRIFDLAFTSKTVRELDDTFPGNDREKAHFTYDGVNFSRASTHVGNSMIIYRPSGEDLTLAGSIEKIEVVNNKVTFVVRRQEPLPAGQTDPFLPFPHFLARMYSSKMSTAIPDRINPSQVVSHCARFDCSDGRAVILNLSRD